MDPQSALPGVGYGYNLPHLKCFYTNTCNVRKKEELQALSQSQKFGITGINETWWGESCVWSALLDVYRLFRRDRQGRRGWELSLYIMQVLDVWSSQLTMAQLRVSV